MSLASRKLKISNDIAKAYSQQLIKVNQTNTTQQVLSEIVVKISQDDGKICEDCLSMFLSKKIIDGISTNPSYRKQYERVAKGVCSGNCYVKLSDINMNNVLVLSSLSAVDTDKIDVNIIAEEVKKSLIKEFGKSADTKNIENDIINIVTLINKNAKFNIDQSFSSLQSIKVEGTGVELKFVSMSLVVDITMRAIDTACNSEGTCAMNIINKIVQEQMDYIRKEVQKNIKQDFTAVWTDNKKYIIAAGITLLALMLAIFVLLIYRAVYGRK